jgi:hypothetical protein
MCIDPLAGLVLLLFLLGSTLLSQAKRWNYDLKNEAIIAVQLFTAVLNRTGKLMSQ